MEHWSALTQLGSSTSTALTSLKLGWVHAPAACSEHLVEAYSCFLQLKRLRLHGALELHRDAMVTVAGLSKLQHLTALDLQLSIDNPRGDTVTIEEGEDLFAALWAAAPAVEFLDVSWYANVGRRQIPAELAAAVFAGPSLELVRISAIVRYLRRTEEDLQTLQGALRGSASVIKLQIEGDAACRRAFEGQTKGTAGVGDCKCVEVI